MDTESESEIESEFDRSNERAILKIVHDVLLDFAAFLHITPGEIMQEIRSRLPKPLAVTDDRTPEELKRDGDDRWPDGSEYHSTFGKLPPMNGEDRRLAESITTADRQRSEAFVVQCDAEQQHEDSYWDDPLRGSNKC